MTENKTYVPLSQRMNSNKIFINLCNKAGITVTKRQYSKFLNGKGKAYQVRGK